MTGSLGGFFIFFPFWNVLHENVFSKEMIYEKVEYWKENEICEKNNDTKSMMLCINACKAQRLRGRGLCAWHPDVWKGETKLPNSLAVEWGYMLNTSKLWNR